MDIDADNCRGTLSVCTDNLPGMFLISSTCVAEMTNTPGRFCAQTDNQDKSSTIIVSINVHHLVQKEASVVNKSSNLKTAHNLNVSPDLNSTVDVTKEPQPNIPSN